MTSPTTSKKPYITTYESMGGWKALMLWWNPDGFWEPWQTGMGGYATEAEAIKEAEVWAKAEELEYRPRAQPSPSV